MQVLVSRGHGQEGCDSSSFFGCQPFKTYSGFLFFLLPCEFLRVWRKVFSWCMEGICLGLVLGSQLAWRALPSPCKRRKQEFGGEGILSCPFCICISPLWHFLQKEPSDPGRGFGVRGDKTGGETAPRRRWTAGAVSG